MRRFVVWQLWIELAGSSGRSRRRLKVKKSETREQDDRGERKTKRPKVTGVPKEDRRDDSHHNQAIQNPLRNLDNEYSLSSVGIRRTHQSIIPTR